MNKIKLSVLIVEDDANACARFRLTAKNYPDLKISKITDSSQEAFQFSNKFLPDVVILDLELHNGSGSGVDYLQKINSGNIKNKIFTIVTTNNSSQVIYNHLHSLNCDYIFHKGERDYSETKVFAFIDSLKDTIIGTVLTEDVQVTSENDYVDYLNSMFDKLGISPKLKGYKYLIDAILLVNDNPSINVYSTLASKYEKSSVSVEHAMLNAINKAWKTSDPDDLYKYYTARIDLDRGSPTVSEFIFYYANKLTYL